MSKTHIARDQVPVDDVFGTVFGFVPWQKTTKTLCGRRVKTSRIVRDEPTCPACRDMLKRWDEETDALLEIIEHIDPAKARELRTKLKRNQ